MSFFLLEHWSLNLNQYLEKYCDKIFFAKPIGLKVIVNGFAYLFPCYG